jgi:hypothetical protein
MDKFIEKINKLSLPAVILIVFVSSVLIGVGLFYWHETRPSRIKSACLKKAEKYVINKYGEESFQKALEFTKQKLEFEKQSQLSPYQLWLLYQSSGDVEKADEIYYTYIEPDYLYAPVLSDYNSYYENCLKEKAFEKVFK